MRRTRLQKGKNSAPESQRVGSLQEPPKKARMTPKYRVRKYKKLTAQIISWRSNNKASLIKAGCTVEGHTQCRPRRKEGKNIDRIDRIDSNKNTPDLRTLVTTHQSERKNNLHPTEGKTWRSVQTVGNSKRWKKMSSCAAWSELHTKSTIDEISGEWMGTNCDEKCSCSNRCENTTADWQKQW